MINKSINADFRKYDSDRISPTTFKMIENNKFPANNSLYSTTTKSFKTTSKDFNKLPHLEKHKVKKASKHITQSEVSNLCVT
jgi:hypothetical protein